MKQMKISIEYLLQRRFIIDSLSKAKKNAEAIKSELYSDILHADSILIN